MNQVRWGDASWITDSWYASMKDDETYNAMAEYLNVTFVGNDWNDECGRTKQEVLDMLENVAIKYDDDAMRSVGNDTV